VSIWLVLALALVLVPLVRVFMADGCTSSAPPGPPHGTRPLRFQVSVSNTHPGTGNPDGDARITGGQLIVQPPAGSSLPPIVIPPGGLVDHELPVTPEMFGSRGGPYEWRVQCNLQFNATRPVEGRMATNTLPFNWDAHTDRRVLSQLRLELTGDTAVRELVWSVLMGVS
jgi:hypothetical protein